MARRAAGGRRAGKPRHAGLRHTTGVIGEPVLAARLVDEASS
jgi:hypothetical protein